MRSVLLSLFLATAAFADELDDKVVKAIKEASRPPDTSNARSLHAQKKYVEAAKAWLDYLARRSDDAEAWYCLACSLSKAGKQASAANAIGQAFRMGFDDTSRLNAEPDLAAVRASEAYRLIQKNIERAGILDVDSLNAKTESFVRIHVAKPEKFDPKKKYGLVLVLHGHASNGEDYVRSVPSWRGEEFVVAGFSAPYPTSTSHGTPGWSWSPLTGTPEEQQAAADMVMDQVGSVLDRLEKQFSIDRARTYLCGSSAGTWVTFRFASLHPDRLAGFLIIAGGGGNEGLEKFAGKRILIAHGVSDMSVPVTSAKSFSAALDKAGVQNELYLYDGEHALTPDMIEGIRRWLRGEPIPAELRAK